MAGHAVRGALTAWGALIVLHTIGTSGGSGKLTSLFTDLDDAVKRALSPDVPAIPDRRKKGFYDDDGNYHPYLPGYLGGGTTSGPGAGDQANPDFQITDLGPDGRAYGPTTDGTTAM